MGVPGITDASDSNIYAAVQFVAVVAHHSGIAQKAACFLLIQSRQTGKKVVRIPESISNWAMVMNVSRSSLHRELKKLETSGIITYDPPTIEIHDPEALQNVLSK
jgi:hypothetical protein